MSLVKYKLKHRLSIRKQRGVGLIEVLLAVVVLSIGFLAAARMQVAGMQANQSALFSSQANFMLRDITDRMRANPVGVANGDYDGMATLTAANLPTCISAQTPCTPNALATADLFSWRSKLYAPPGAINFVPALPSANSITARGEIARDAATDSYALSMYWSEFDDEGIAQEQRLRVHFTP